MWRTQLKELRYKRIVTPIFRGFLLAFVVVACGGNAELPVKSSIAPHESANSKIIPAPLMATDTIRQLEAYFSERSDAGRLSGVVLLAHNHSIFKGKFGFSNFKDQDTFLFDDKFQLASLSKPITAMGVLKLVDKGKLELDAPVNQYLTDFPFEKVTVRSLLSHTSGLGNYIYVTDSLWNNPDSFMNNDNVYEIIRCNQLPKYYEPLERFDYCNTNFVLLPILIEEVTGTPFEVFMQKEIFEPIGMFQTEYLSPKEKPSDAYHVLGHYPSGAAKRPFYLDGVVGDKSLYSTVYDLYKLYEEIKHPTLFKPSIMADAMSPQVKTSYNRFYGLGWRLNPQQDGDTIVFHNGWWRGFRSYFWMSKKQDKVAIILTNSIQGGYLKQEEIWSLF